MAETAAAAAAALAAAWPADRPLRVLDLGGAALTRHLLAALAEDVARAVDRAPDGVAARIELLELSLTEPSGGPRDAGEHAAPEED